MNSKLSKPSFLLNYRKFLKEAGKLNYYNFRQHMQRKVKYDFREKYAKEATQQELKEKFAELQRIVTVQNLYSSRD